MSALKGTILLTGANGGLGSGFVSNLISFPYVSNYRAIYTVRNPLTSHDLQAILAKAPKSHVSETIALDLSTLSGVRKVAAEINAKVSSGEWEPIRALVLNAAWQEANSSTLTAQTYTEDGYEAHFAINYLANFLFVLLLLESMDKEHGRIVMVSSFAHDAYDPRNDLRGVWKEQEYKIMFPNGEDGVQKLAKGLEYKDDGYKGGMRRYGASKLLLVMLMYELQRRLNTSAFLNKISVVSLDPGAMGGTGLVKSSPFYIRVIVKILALVQGVLVYLSPNGMVRTTFKSGTDLLLCCFDEKNLGEHPKAVFMNGSLKAESSVESRDEVKQKLLWVESLKMAKIRKGDTVLENWQ